MSRRPQVQLGSFVVGEVPAPLEYQFQNENGAPINLTGYTTARFQWGEWSNETTFIDPVIETATITDAVNGEVTYVWDGDELDRTGRYAGIFFVNNGIQQYASILVVWQVCAAVGVPPLV